LVAENRRKTLFPQNGFLVLFPGKWVSGIISSKWDSRIISWKMGYLDYFLKMDISSKCVFGSIS